MIFHGFQWNPNSISNLIQYLLYMTESIYDLVSVRLCQFGMVRIRLEIDNGSQLHITYYIIQNVLLITHYIIQNVLLNIYIEYILGIYTNL